MVIWLTPKSTATSAWVCRWQSRSTTVTQDLSASPLLHAWDALTTALLTR